MKTQDTRDTDADTLSSHISARSQRHGWRTSFIAVVIVALIVGLSSLVFAQLSTQRGHIGKGIPGVPSGKWEAVLRGYTITELFPAHNNPSTLYACATAINPTASYQRLSYTVLRSTDFGSHWQDVGSKVIPGDSCQIAVNSTNSNDVYVVGSAATGQAGNVLKHSSDGGQTWSTITPTLSLPAVQKAVAWNVQHIMSVGNSLFGIAGIPFRGGPLPVTPGTPVLPKVAISSSLVRSTDGGHSWTALDTSLMQRGQGARDYAVDPAQASTIYELIGATFGPVQGNIKGTLPTLGTGVGTLYKTSDSGATWHTVLQNIPYNSQVLLANAQPAIVYVGGTFGPLPYLPRVPTSDPLPVLDSSFHLQISSNGGDSWKAVTPPPLPTVQTWLVDANGHAYAYSGIGYSMPGVQPTVTKGTAVPGGSGTIVPGGTGKPILVPPSSNVVSNIGLPITGQGNTTAGSTDISRYDPASGSWQKATSAPAAGSMITVTPVDTRGGAALWFMGMEKGEMVLYRYVV